IRDMADIRPSSVPCFCRGVTPRGPHLEFGGTIGATTAVGNVPVSPGDLILGDDDGVVVVPLRECAAVLEKAQQHLNLEKAWLEGVRSGKVVSQLFDLPDVYVV